MARNRAQASHDTATSRVRPAAFALVVTADEQAHRNRNRCSRPQWRLHRCGIPGVSAGFPPVGGEDLDRFPRRRQPPTLAVPARAARSLARADWDRNRQHVEAAPAPRPHLGRYETTIAPIGLPIESFRTRGVLDSCNAMSEIAPESLSSAAGLAGSKRPCTSPGFRWTSPSSTVATSTCSSLWPTRWRPARCPRRRSPIR